ncbi:glutaredoxin [Pontixanthobacter aestiaquae]|uniref:Methylamine utilization protein MauE n=1 Tax=Pontixanthobacter aestiaquae TaxID=1509367 RepID=A0A844Z7N4_9SPHN|nr:glutaredoxin [Pontixanthobacter aestiaquae]MDN3645477.1 glutaredoxin [Pontixanthobacter aestiaquae]MXO83524.1 glutaredoxin [Pontixanthobacter aestiaquae]
MSKNNNTAKLYRMVMDEHVCPYGIKSKFLLERRGFTVEDHHLTSREEVDAIKAAHGVETTPQTFIDGQRIGGYTDLREKFGKPVKDPNATSYRPVLVLFAVGLALAASLSMFSYGTALTVRTAEWFVAFSMAMLAMLKLQDVEKFSSMFLGYDLLAKRYVPYSYAYPYLEALAAILMAGHLLPWLSIPIAFTIGMIGAISVIYAVYIQKRDIKCACVGGSANVPLGFISLSENIAMVAMAVWMLFRYVL